MLHRALNKTSSLFNAFFLIKAINEALTRLKPVAPINAGKPRK